MGHFVEQNSEHLLCLSPLSSSAVLFYGLKEKEFKRNALFELLWGLQVLLLHLLMLFLFSFGFACVQRNILLEGYSFPSSFQDG